MLKRVWERGRESNRGAFAIPVHEVFIYFFVSREIDISYREWWMQEEIAHAMQAG